jgi:hypothetical protein
MYVQYGIWVLKKWVTERLEAIQGLYYKTRSTKYRHQRKYKYSKCETEEYQNNAKISREGKIVETNISYNTFLDFIVWLLSPVSPSPICLCGA